MQSANAATTVAQSVADAAEIVIKQQTSVDNGSQAVSNITDSINAINAAKQKAQTDALIKQIKKQSNEKK